MNPQQPVYVLAPPPQQQQNRPVLAWLFALAMAFLAANGGKLPTLPNLPPFPLPTAPPAVPPAPSTTPPAAPAPGPMPAPMNPTAAICRIQFGTAGCTAAPLNVRRDDGRAVLLTAAHCVSAVGAKGKAVFKDGRSLAVSVVARDATTDCAILLTELPAADLPALKLAERSPAPGARVWHAGYGVDRPANREEGERVDVVTSTGKIAFKLNVSSGDSGGPIIHTDTGEVVSCVCCTESRGALARMYGASTENIRALLARVTSNDEWKPAELPTVEPGT